MRHWDKIVSFSDINDWRRGGAETFVADSVLVTELCERRHVIGKALVSFASSADRFLTSWIARREQLSRLGIRVPFLYSTGPGIILEEFIQGEFCITDCDADQLNKDLARAAVLLDLGGFEPLSFLKDLRRRGHRVYYVDFGSDLADPERTSGRRARLELERNLQGRVKSKCLHHYVFTSNKCRILFVRGLQTTDPINS
jgi:hypothetical protein